jgi:hypothetical protein
MTAAASLTRLVDPSNLLAAHWSGIIMGTGIIMSTGIIMGMEIIMGKVIIIGGEL